MRVDQLDLLVGLSKLALHALVDPSQTSCHLQVQLHHLQQQQKAHTMLRAP